MITSCRVRVQSATSAHIGLWLDRYLPVQADTDDKDKNEANQARDELIRQALTIHQPDGYIAALQRWQDELALDALRIACATADTTARILVGSGQKNPLEFGITLHRTWGLPYLPGSSLKGIAAVGAQQFQDQDQWQRRNPHSEARPGGPNAYDALFGDVEEQGAVIFHDAWFVPKLNDKGTGLHRDVLTVHHPDYYQNGKVEPSDTDNPNPVPFISAFGRFLVALELNPALDPAAHGHWLEAAWTALRAGLATHGVGAKTNAGYGRVHLPEWSKTTTAGELTRLRNEIDLTAEREEAERAQRDRLGRRATMTPVERVADVGSDEGIPALRAWLETGGGRELAGLDGTAEHVRAAATAVREGRLAGGLKAAAFADWAAWVQEGLDARATPEVVSTATTHLSDHEIDRILDQNLGKRGTDFDKAAKVLAKKILDPDSLARAIAALQAKGAKPGHVKELQSQLQART